MGDASRGRPARGRVPGRAAEPEEVEGLSSPAGGEPPRTPYDVLVRTEVPRPTAESLLLALCRGLEREALTDPPPRVEVLLQDARHLTPATLRVYTALAAAGSEVTAHARGLQAWVAPGVRGVDLPDGDPLADVWGLVFLHPRRPVALAALDRTDVDTAGPGRPFEVVMTRDPGVVEECARVLGVGSTAGGPPAPAGRPPGAGAPAG